MSLTHPNSSTWHQMLKNTFLLNISKGESYSAKNPVHDIRYCKPLLSLPSARGKVLHTQTSVLDFRCFTTLLSLPLAWGESSHSNSSAGFNIKTTSLLNISKGGSFTHPNSSAWLQMFQTVSLLTISKGGVFPTQSLVHDSWCCKQLLYWPLERRESYHPKFQCMSTDVANRFSPEN